MRHVRRDRHRPPLVALPPRWAESSCLASRLPPPLGGGDVRMRSPPAPQASWEGIMSSAPSPERCEWASIEPGVTAIPSSSISMPLVPAKGRISSFRPTAANRDPLTASASERNMVPSTVETRGLCGSRSRATAPAPDSFRRLPQPEPNGALHRPAAWRDSPHAESSLGTARRPHCRLRTGCEGACWLQPVRPSSGPVSLPSPRAPASQGKPRAREPAAPGLCRNANCSGIADRPSNTHLRF